MITVCEICGDVGYEYLLVSCNDCKGTSVHQYCLDKVVFVGSLVDWLCYECQPRHSGVTYERSLQKVPNQRQPNHAYFGSSVHQPSTPSVESTKESGPWRNHKNKSYKTKSTSLKRICSTRMNSLARKGTREKSNMRPMGNKANTRDRNATNYTCTSGKAFHSCEAISVETANASSGENQQVDNEHSVHTLNNDRVANGLPPRVKQTNLQKPLDGSGSPFPKEQGGSFCSLQEPPKENLKIKFVKDKKPVVGAQSKKCWVMESLKNLDKPETYLDIDDNVIDDFMLERDKTKARFQLDDKASNDLQSTAASVPQTSTLHKNSVDRAMPSSANMDVLPQESNCLLSEHIDIENAKGSCVTPVLTGGNQSGPSRLLDQVYSSSFSETSSKANIVLEASAIEVELSDTVRNFVNDNPMKRRRLILLDDDDDEEEASDVQPENSNPRSLECDGSMKKNRIDTEDIVQHFLKDNPRKRRRLVLLDDDDDEEEAADVQPENSNPRSLEYDGSKKKNRIDTEDYMEAVQTGDLNGQDLMNVRPVKKQKSVQDGEHAVQLDILIPQSSEITWPVKKRRRYIDANEDEEDEEVITGSENAKCALNDVGKLASQTVVAKDQLLQSRTTFDSQSANQQCNIYSQPIDDPVWSGIFKINNQVFVTLAAHLSTKACQRVWELSKSLQSVVEVKKLPRLEAWPKSWKTSGPTDDSIGLFFFPNSIRPNEESDRLVEEVIESDAVLKIVVGIAELLIFPSTLLPEQYHVFQGKHYLWGVFKHREDRSDKVVLVKERDGSACAAEEGEVQEHHLLEQKYEVQCESSDQETFVVKHVLHVENQLLAESNCEAQKEAMTAAMREGLASPGSSSSSAKSSPKAGSRLGSNCFLQPRISRKLHAAEEVDQQGDEQDFTSSAQWNALNVAKAGSRLGSNYFLQPRVSRKLHAAEGVDQQGDEQDFTSSLQWNALNVTKPSSDSEPAAVTPKLINTAERDHGQPRTGVVPPTKTTLFGFVAARTPRSQQLIQEMAREGALLFSVSEEMVTPGSTVGNGSGVELDVTPDILTNEYPHMQERPQSFDFVSMDHDDPDVASEACLELFPVRQEHIGWTPRVEVGKEVDLDLGLGARS